MVGKNTVMRPICSDWVLIPALHHVFTVHILCRSESTFMLLPGRSPEGRGQSMAGVAAHNRWHARVFTQGSGVGVLLAVV